MTPEEHWAFINEVPDPPMHWDRLGHPICLREWGELMEDFEYRVIAKTMISARWEVSTVWLGIDVGLTSIFGGVPCIFETMVFDTTGDPDIWAGERSRYHDYEQERYPTEGLAREGHERMVQLVMTLEGTVDRIDV